MSSNVSSMTIGFSLVPFGGDDKAEVRFVEVRFVEARFVVARGFIGFVPVRRDLRFSQGVAEARLVRVTTALCSESLLFEVLPRRRRRGSVATGSEGTALSIDTTFSAGPAGPLLDASKSDALSRRCRFVTLSLGSIAGTILEIRACDSVSIAGGGPDDSPARNRLVRRRFRVTEITVAALRCIRCARADTLALGRGLARLAMPNRADASGDDT